MTEVANILVSCCHVTGTGAELHMHGDAFGYLVPQEWSSYNAAMMHACVT